MTRFETHARSLGWLARGRVAALMIGVASALLGSAAIAQAETARWAWTAAKAQQVVGQKATVQVPTPLKASLLSELVAAVRLYSALEMAAIEVGDANALATFQSLEVRYRRALESVRGGLDIDEAACTGIGVPRQVNRFARFRCVVTSDPLGIPSAKLDYGDGELPAVIEGPPRLEGPFKALLDVRVVGKSAIAYRTIV